MPPSKSLQPLSPRRTSSVQVVVRLRPLNDKEKKHGTLPVVSASTSDKTVTVIKGSGSRQVRTNYKFDNIFGTFSSQEEVFEATLKPVIRDVLNGFESTVFAYGQTGTGKTHTMEGDLGDPEQYGVIPRSAKAIFDALDQPEFVSKSVSVSFLEIYNEDLCDLLVTKSKKPKLDIMEGKNGPFCRGLSESQVTSAEHVLTLMRSAQQQRQVGETNMNKQSSRSHCIFTLCVQAKRKLPDDSLLEVSGKLHCVDLAGSECAKSAGLDKYSDGEQAARERERLNINRSLLTLGRVVSLLKEQSNGKQKNARIPYRDSKLTRILQESLGGRCKTCLIATVSPSVTAIEESMSTLNYAQAANGIVNKPITTSFMTNVGSTSSNGVGNSKPSSADGGVIEHWHEMECRLQYMQTQVEEAQQALARKHLQQQELVEKATQAETAMAKSQADLQVESEKNLELQSELAACKGEKEVLSQQLSKTEATLEEITLVLKATQNTELTLTQEAQALLQALLKSIATSDDMYNGLIQQRDEDLRRKQETKSFRTNMASLMEELQATLSIVGSLETEHFVSLQDSVHSSNRQHIQHIEQYTATTKDIAEHVNETMSNLKENLIKDASSYVSVSSKAQESISSAIANVVEENKQLQSSCNKIKEGLEVSISHLQEVEKGYDVVSSELLQSLAQNLAESRKKLSEIIASVSNSMESAHTQRIKSGKALRSILENWKCSSLEHSNTVRTTSGAQRTQMTTSLQMLQSEVVRHEEISKQLAGQRAFLQETRERYLGDLKLQGRLLCQQKQVFEESHHRQEDFCQKFMSNVMQQVQTIMQNQLSEIEKHQQESYNKLVSGNQKLSDVHAGVEASASAILSSIASTNNVVQENVEKVRETESKISGALETSDMALHDMQVACQGHEAETVKKFETALQEMSDQEESETKATNQIIQGCQTDVAACSAHLETVEKRVRDSVECLSTNMKNVFSNVSENIIDATKSRIENTLQSPCDEYSSQIKTSLDEACLGVGVAEENFQYVCKEQSNLADAMKEYTSSVVVNVEKISTEQSQSIENQKAVIIQSLEKHQAEVSKKLSESESRVSASNAAVCDFSRNVLRVDEETPSVKELNIPDYSEVLSSTPSVDVILRKSQEEEEKGKGADGSDEKENSTNASSQMAMRDEKLEDDSSNMDQILMLRETDNNTFSGEEKASSGDIVKKRGAPQRSIESKTKRVRTKL